MPYDVVVVDCFATGHFEALCMAPVGLAEAVRFGPMGEHSRMIVEILKNQRNSQMVVVTLPEELPVNEALELHGFLVQNFVQNPRVVINRNLPLPLSEEELQIAKAKFKTLSHPPAWGVEFCDYLSEQGLRQEEAQQKIRATTKNVIELPFYFLNHWPELLRALSDDLEKKWPAG
ncbi:MAG: hypothetical protein AB7K41_14395, partial [Bdellovibrionales bacterium]